jgi:hypothetical protein
MTNQKPKRIQRDSALKFMYLGYRGDISALDAEGKSLLWRAGDLRARWMMQDISEREYESGNCEGACTLIHAERYLSDRLSYELHPWPKGMVKDETITPLPDRCPHCDKIILEPDGCSQCGRIFCSLKCTLEHPHDILEIANA